jgi:hypothetical protein
MRENPKALSFKPVQVQPRKSDSELVATPQPEADGQDKHFQAIGTIQAIVERDDAGDFFIRMGARSYNLYVPRRHKRARVSARKMKL